MTINVLALGIVKRIFATKQQVLPLAWQCGCSSQEKPQEIVRHWELFRAHTVQLLGSGPRFEELELATSFLRIANAQLCSLVMESWIAGCDDSTDKILG